VGCHPARAVEPSQLLVDQRWAARIRELTRPPAGKLLATSVYEIIKAEGFTGSYVTVARHLRDVRGPRSRAAPAVSVPVTTAPGEEAQSDWPRGRVLLSQVLSDPGLCKSGWPSVDQHGGRCRRRRARRAAARTWR